MHQYKIYPWIHQYNNHKSRDSQLEACTFPDRNPSDMPHNSNFSMAAGDFLDVYTDPGSSASLLQQYLSLRAQTFCQHSEAFYMSHIETGGGVVTPKMGWQEFVPKSLI